MRVTYDPESDAAYVYLAQTKLGEAVEQRFVEGGLILDFDKDGRLLGIEALDATRQLRPEILRDAVLPGTRP